MTPLVWGERGRGRTWVNSGREAMERAEAAERKAAPWAGPSELASLCLVALGQEESTPGQGTRHRGHRDLVAVGMKECPELAVPPGGKGCGVAGGNWLQGIYDGSRPAPWTRSYGALPAVPARTGDAKQGAEPEDRERCLAADQLEVREAG